MTIMVVKLRTKKVPKMLELYRKFVDPEMSEKAWRALGKKRRQAAYAQARNKARNDPQAADPPPPKAPVTIPRLSYKGTFNTHDIMHAPVEKTIKMLQKIIAGERIFTM